MGYQMVEKVLR